MRSQSFLFLTAAFVLLSSSTAAAGSEAWSRRPVDGLEVDVPRGWTMEAENRNRIWMFENRDLDGYLQIGLFRSAADDKSNALAIARESLEKVQFANARLRSEEGGRDVAVLLADDLVARGPALIGVRVTIHRKAGRADIDIVRGKHSHFVTEDGWGKLDRARGSLGRFTGVATHFSTWRLVRRVEDRVSLPVPSGWTISTTEKDGIYKRTYELGGKKDLNTFRIVSFQTATDPKQHTDLINELAGQVLPTHAIRVNPLKGHKGPILFYVHGERRNRAAVIIRENARHLAVVVAFADEVDFWTADIPGLVNYMLDHQSLGRHGVRGRYRGIWTAGRHGAVMDVLNLNQVPMNRLEITLDLRAKGTYELAYRWREFSKERRIETDDSGEFSIEGEELVLVPRRRTRRKLYRKFEGKPNETDRLKAAQLATYRLRCKVLGPYWRNLYLSSPDLFGMGMTERTGLSPRYGDEAAPFEPLGDK